METSATREHTLTELSLKAATPTSDSNTKAEYIKFTLMPHSVFAAG